MELSFKAVHLPPHNACTLSSISHVWNFPPVCYMQAACRRSGDFDETQTYSDNSQSQPERTRGVFTEYLDSLER